MRARFPRPMCPSISAGSRKPHFTARNSPRKHLDSFSPNYPLNSFESGSLKRHDVQEAKRRSSINAPQTTMRSEEHTSELQSHVNLVCRLLLEKKKKKKKKKNDKTK